MMFLKTLRSRVGLAKRSDVRRGAQPAAGGPRAICVLGMHCSGTSVIARALNLLGVYLGAAEHFMPPSPDNPKGYWELLDICALHDQILALFDRRWDSLEALPPGWPASKKLRRSRQELARQVKRHFARHPLWGWKDPRTCLLLPLWRAVLAELDIPLSCLFVVRNPLAVANSLKKRDGIPVPNGLQLWFRHYLTALRSATGLSLAFVNFDRFVESWEQPLRQCAARLALQWPADEAWLRTEMNRFVEPVLCHHRASSEELQETAMAVGELFHALCAAADRPGPPAPEFYALVDRLAAEPSGEVQQLRSAVEGAGMAAASGRCKS